MGIIGQGLSPFGHLHPFALSDWVWGRPQAQPTPQASWT
ncbi:unnamed protein product [Brassica rapa subsp. narinosa]